MRANTACMVACGLNQHSLPSVCNPNLHADRPARRRVRCVRRVALSGRYVVRLGGPSRRLLSSRSAAGLKRRRTVSIRDPSGCVLKQRDFFDSTSQVSRSRYRSTIAMPAGTSTPHQCTMHLCEHLPLGMLMLHPPVVVRKACGHLGQGFLALRPLGRIGRVARPRLLHRGHDLALLRP